jgi:hypothetical protein
MGMMSPPKTKTGIELALAKRCRLALTGVLESSSAIQLAGF